MGFKRLEKNLIDIIKEEQAKLGFRKEEIRLYYPLISLRRMTMWMRCRHVWNSSRKK